MSTIVTNPTLTGFSTPPVQITDASGNVGYIENPDGWQFVYLAQADAKGNLPQSLHRDRGYVIAAGWRKWEAGYRQAIRLRAGQRYLAKAVFMVNADQKAGIEWRHSIVGQPSDYVHSSWSRNPAGHKKEDEHLFVFEARQDMEANFTFWARSEWPDNECDFCVYLLTVEAVPADYGGSNVPYIGTVQPTPTPVPTPIPVPVPTPGNMTTRGLIYQQIAAHYQALAALHVQLAELEAAGVG